MEKSYYLSSTFNNIVFKGRNQAYGAYVLRRNYSRHMTLAAILATALFSGALVGPLVKSVFFAEQEKYVKPVLDITGPIVIEMPNLPKLPDEAKKEVAPAAEPEKQVKTEEFVKPKVVKENTQTATKTMPDQSELSKVHIGRNTLDGEIPEFSSAAPEEAPASGSGIGAGEPAAAPTEFIHAEVMPEFTGGDDALFRYLGQNMRYPQAAQRAGIEGTVVVTFVVAPDGAITKAEVVKGLGYGTEEEALRVINNMPAWQPGRQNGRAVPVRYTIPIRFSLK